MKDILSNGLNDIISQAIEEMEEEQGPCFSLEKINLADLERRTGISRSKLRRLKENNFKIVSHKREGTKAIQTVLSGYTTQLNKLLSIGVTNSAVCYERLREAGYTGGLTTVKNYISKHRDLVPAKRQMVAPQGSRGYRYSTGPGESYQMDWGFTKVLDYGGHEFTAACFAMICHHCGQRYVEFFPNAKQENLFIGMLHAFYYMGVPEYVLTDNMKSVVIKRDLEGHPVWQKDYEAFMNAVGFRTKLCKPRHPFTKGKVERLVRFVKQNFLAGRVFWNVTDLNRAALDWCNLQNSTYHKALFCVPQEVHECSCANVARPLVVDPSIEFYLCPERRISFDGFINYEGRRFGVPYSYKQSTARVQRKDDVLYIYSADMRQLLATHSVTWSKRDQFCSDQYAIPSQPEEFPTMPVKTQIIQLPEPESSVSFDKFDFDKEDDWND